MSNILNPLDNIIATVNGLIKCQQSARRGNNINNTLETILNDINTAKNNIIIHLLDKKHENQPISEPCTTQSYKSAVKSKNTATNNIIIPIADKKPDTKEIKNVETRVFSLFEKKNLDATILRTSTSDKGNYIIKFKNDDNIQEIKSHFVEEFGDVVKTNQPIHPKIKIVSVPHYFPTNNKTEVIKSILKGNEILQSFYNLDNKCIEFLFSYSVNGNKSIIMKCSPKVRKCLKENGDVIKVGHQQCKLFDRYHLLQCSNCCNFGHTSKTCKKENSICTFCSQSHSFKTCPHKNDHNYNKCHNCAVSHSNDIQSNSHTHNAFSSECPVKKHHFQRLICRTDTGETNL